MKTLAWLWLLMCPMASFGMDRLAALSMIETGNNDRMVGRAGEISRYQILKSEWRSVTNSTRYTDPATAKAVTEQLLARRLDKFRVTHSRNPTNFEFYALWNAPGQVLDGRVTKRVAERCRRYANLCDWKGMPVPVGSSKSEMLASRN
jgi:hypothetical protein